MPLPLQSYPAYKSSSFEWLGDVPAHWEVRRLKSWVSVNEAVLPEATEPEFKFRYVEIGDVGTGVLVSEPVTTRFENAPSRARRIVRTGDTIVSTVRTYLKATWFAGEVKDDLICSTGFAVLTPRNDVWPKFLSYITQSDPFTERVTASSVGTAYPAIPESLLGSFHVALPPLHEQQVIVRYLDYTDRHIRRYVTRKRKLMALLEEEKQAIVNQAVTRGLDPNVRLKPSGVEWLSNVPEHWERRRLKTILEPIDQRSSTGAETLLSLRRDYGVVVYGEHFARPSQSRSLVGFKLVRIGQLVLNRLQANNGLIFHSTLDGLVSPDYSVFQEKFPLQMQYLSDLLRTPSYRAYFRQNATGLGTGTAGFLRLYDDKFLSTLIYLPPLSEQNAIIRHLDRATVEIEAAVARARRQIELLEEYRTRLVADVVTGKLDVRDAAAQIPDDTDGLAPVEESDPLAGGIHKVLHQAEDSTEELEVERKVTA